MPTTAWKRTSTRLAGPTLPRLLSCVRRVHYRRKDGWRSEPKRERRASARLSRARGSANSAGLPRHRSIWSSKLEIDDSISGITTPSENKVHLTLTTTLLPLTRRSVCIWRKDEGMIQRQAELSGFPATKVAEIRWESECQHLRVDCFSRRRTARWNQCDHALWRRGNGHGHDQSWIPHTGGEDFPIATGRSNRQVRVERC